MTGIYDGEQGEHPHPPLSRTDEARALADDVAILNGRRRGDIARVLRQQADALDDAGRSLDEQTDIIQRQADEIDRLRADIERLNGKALAREAQIEQWLAVRRWES